MHVLAAGVDSFVIVRRDSQGHGPNKAILQVGSGPPARRFRPYLDVPGLAGPEVVALDDAADTAGARGARPDDVLILRVRRRPSAFTAGHRLPRAPGNLSAAKAAAAAKA